MPPGQRSQYGGNPYWINQEKVYTPLPAPMLPSPGGQNYSKGSKSTQKLINTPRLYEQDIINAATQPRSYVPAYPTAPTSPIVQPGANRPHSTGGGVGTVPSIAAPVGPAFVPLTADYSLNPMGAPYDELLKYVRASADYRPKVYNAARETFKKDQEIANQQMYDAYANSRLATDTAARNLGVDPGAVSANRDNAMRYSQENSDQALADNLAWLTKAGLLDQQMTTATGNMYAGEKARAVAKWNADEDKRIADLNLATLQDLVNQKLAKSKGGGGGRKKGGGGGSSGVKESATETSTSFGDEDLAYYNALGPGTPEAELFKNFILSNSKDPALKAGQGYLNETSAKKAAAFMPDNGPYAPKPSNTQNKWQGGFAQSKALTAAAKARDALIGRSGDFGGVKTSRQVKSTSKRS